MAVSAVHLHGTARRHGRPQATRIAVAVGAVLAIPASVALIGLGGLARLPAASAWLAPLVPLAILYGLYRVAGSGARAAAGPASAILGGTIAGMVAEVIVLLPAIGPLGDNPNGGLVGLLYLVLVGTSAIGSGRLTRRRMLARDVLARSTTRLPPWRPSP